MSRTWRFVDYLLIAVCLVLGFVMVGLGLYSCFARHNQFGVPDGIKILFCSLVLFASAALVRSGMRQVTR